MSDSVARFDKALAKEIVKQALKKVADFRGDNIEHFTFSRFEDFHKMLFLSALKAGVQSVRYDDTTHYDIILDHDSMDKWKTVGDCINWVNGKCGLIGTSNTKKLSRAELEG
ncbi:MAG: hypothetical protein JSV52_15580 [Candidatus Zixiibacteriota bacterium]|nr:MAG: hypothetical protein JSV52_15580 [candidate division Zixibacteria bacterium]